MKRKHYRLMAPENGGEGGAAGADATTATDAATTSTAAAATTTTATDSQNSAQPWTQSIADESLRKYAEGKQFKEPADAAKALQELETKYAAPATPDDYKLPVPDGQDGAFAKQASAWMHKAGIPAAAGQALAVQWNEFQASQAQDAQVAQQQKAEQEITTLRGEWGAQFDANVELGRRAMSTFGVPVEMIDQLAGKMGDAQVMKVFQSIGKSMSESTLNPGGSASSAAPSADPEAARAARMFPSMRKT